ncbi:N-6 DNA methylase [Hymenobacter sp. BT175]|uniref:N-6 DNA methylase n=1 Tax=Hymenobacter translucens TaxID=2886507 RepID=UPI001D0E02BB|nr:N-6 DNA methylase [Hymenobacter translucens]MCC2546414.1 N-6 DNA methylase [Hymenobacter translucens]
MTNYYSKFVKLLEQLGRRHSIERVFGDFLILATGSYHPTNLASRGRVTDEANEAEYLAISKAYTREELNGMAELMALVMLDANERPYSDMLGEYFTEHITRGHNGQFFTPDSICKLMTGLTSGSEPVVNKTVADPACGSGRMLLAFAEQSPGNTFFAADVDQRCARMTVLNFFANGITGEVAWMNTLSMECWRAWHVHSGFFGVLPVPVEQCIQAARPTAAPAARPAAPMAPPPLPSTLRAGKEPALVIAEQLSLF